MLVNLDLIAAPSQGGYDFVPIQEQMQIAQRITEKHGMVSSQEALARSWC